MKHKFLRLCSIVLVLTLICNMLPLQIFAEEFQELLSSDPVQTAPITEGETEALEKGYIIDEVEEKRTEYSKEFRLSSGLSMTAMYPTPVHYLSDGKWEDIDNTLTVSGDSYTNTAGAWELSFPQELTEDERITVSLNGTSLSFGMAGELRESSNVSTYALGRKEHSVHKMTRSHGRPQAQKTPDRDEKYPELTLTKLSSRMEYQNIYGTTDLQYDVNPNQLKESVILESYSSTLLGYQYALETDGLTPVLGEDGGILFTNAEGKVVLSMPAPFLVDNNGVYNYDIQVTLEQTGNSWLLSYRLPRQWLASTDRAWPVVLDPIISTVTTTANIKDQTVFERRESAYNWGILQAGKSNSDGISRFYVMYQNLPTLTSADVIVGATVSLQSVNAGTLADTVVEVRKVNGTWNSETLKWSNQPAISDKVEDYAVVGTANRYYWDVTDIVRGWYTGENTGMVFTVPDSVATGTFKQFYSSDYSDYNNSKPALAIYFRNTNGLESYWDYTSSSAGRAGTGYVNNFSGNLVWIRNDMGFGGNRMPVSINHVYNSNDRYNNTFGLGYGWRTNYNQLVCSWTDSASGSQYYAWEDGDGTKHYFSDWDNDGTYQDEDGLELKLTVNTSSGNPRYVIEDKNGNQSQFDAMGRLRMQINNQDEESNITITYRENDSYCISTITDGAGRVYRFYYDEAEPDSGNYLLYSIQYTGTGTTVRSYVDYFHSYGSWNLTYIEDQDGEACTFTYSSSGHLLYSATDIDGYKLDYSYIGGVSSYQPFRVSRIREYDGTTLGGELNIAYSHNQTTFTDHNEHVEILQFNDFGNVVSIQDGEGRAQHAQYALDTKSQADDNNDPTKKANQLRISSKLQNTVGNLTRDSSFENSGVTSYWTLNTSGATKSKTTEKSYLGNASMKLVYSSPTRDVYALGPTFVAEAGKTYTMSAYVKTVGMSIFYGITNVSTWSTKPGGSVPKDQDWIRVEMVYTNNTGSNITYRPCFASGQSGTFYVDCVQIEQTTTASRYNLVENGDFRYTIDWTANSNNTAQDTYATLSAAAAPTLNSTVFALKGDPLKTKSISQTVNMSGGKGDTYVLAGWAKGDSAPLNSDEEDTTPRRFGLVATFNNTDGTKTERTVSFNPDMDSQNTWQYAAIPVIADKAYSSIQISVVYDYNVNTAYFDGIQLFKEEFGTSYEYDENGNITSVTDLQKQKTSYTFADNELTSMVLPSGVSYTYVYDDYHNVKTATTSTGQTYTFNYDVYGNNTKVTITAGGMSISSEAHYTADGNYLDYTKDAAGNETKYGYNTQTGVLEWVQYPEDTADTRTEYTYDEMYRLTLASAETDIDSVLYADYYYEQDQLMEILTGTTYYTFSYGDFGLISSIRANDNELASYTYTNDRNYYLEELAYGNDDRVQYTYDDYGRVTKQTYEDGDTVTYQYNNDGALATVTSSDTGLKTTYYYDFSSRMMKYVETGSDFKHSVGYAYDNINNLTSIVETINGVDYTTSYTYDADNRVNSVTSGGVTRSYTYDDYGRVTQEQTLSGNTVVMTKVYTYRNISATATTTQIATCRVYGGDYDVTYSYTYDDNGNILTISDGTYTTSYVYDSQNQLIRENNQEQGYTYKWEYDDAGNILKKRLYAYTTGTLGTATSTYNYTYDDNWGDVLVGVGSTTYTVDAIGNRTSRRYGTSSYATTYTWEHGRQLASVTNGTNTWQYKYNNDGLLIEQRNGNDVYTYVYNGTQLSQMKFVGAWEEYTMHFTYDANGTPLTVTFDYAYYMDERTYDNATGAFVDDVEIDYTISDTYYYITNIQGDVIELLNSDGESAGYYQYDAWGDDVDWWEIEEIICYNPLLYRGYFLDPVSNLYYLQTRFYDASVGRFISADAYVSTGQGVLGYNMFAYCGNNPVKRVDPSGRLFWTIMGFVAVTVLVISIPSSSDQSPTYEQAAVKKYNSETVNVYKQDVGIPDSSKLNAQFYDADIEEGHVNINIDKSLDVENVYEMEAVIDVIIESDYYREDKFGDKSFMTAQWLAHNACYDIAASGIIGFKIMQFISGSSDPLASSNALDIRSKGNMLRRQEIIYTVISWLV